MKGIIIARPIGTSSTGSNVIGPAEDGTYTDGLFTDFTPNTPTGTAVDRFNEVLKSLVPSPAPSLSDISIADTGVSGRLSFGTSNNISGYSNHPSLDINGLVTITTLQRGIFNASNTINGVLAENVPPNANGSYPANAFGNASSGSLILEVNGTTVHSVGLDSFLSGNSINASGSGFTSLSSPTPVQFSNGDPFGIFQYRTGSWIVSPSDQRPGYNTARVRHELPSGSFSDTQTYSWINDDNVSGTLYSGEDLFSLNMLGSAYLSGVEYYLSGSAFYSITASNPHRNTYSNSSTAVSHPTTTRCSISNEPLGPIVSDGDVHIINSGSVTVDTNNRILGQPIVVNTRIDRTVQPDVNSSGVSKYGILLDPFILANTSNDGLETFNDEKFRMHEGINITDTAYGTGGPQSSNYSWSDSFSIVGADPNYNTGLLLYNGGVCYPTEGINGGDFSIVPDGPPGNVDYSSATGERTYLRYFYDPRVVQNYNFAITVQNTTFVAATNIGSLSGNQVAAQILAPNTTQNGAAVIEWKDMTIPFTTINDIGAYAATFGSTIPTSWGASLGTRSTATSGKVVVLKFTASSAWVGCITNISATFLV